MARETNRVDKRVLPILLECCLVIICFQFIQNDSQQAMFTATLTLDSVYYLQSFISELSKNVIQSYQWTVDELEFSLNVFRQFSDKNIFIAVKQFVHATSCVRDQDATTAPAARHRWETGSLKGLEPSTSCVRDQDATTAPARHMWETGSLKWSQFMLQWFISFTECTEFIEFLFHLGKTPLLKIINLKNMHKTHKLAS